MGLYTGGLIFGIVRVLVNWWAYTWGGGREGPIFGGGLYSEVYGIHVALIIDEYASSNQHLKMYVVTNQYF